MLVPVNICICSDKDSWVCNFLISEKFVSSIGFQFTLIHSHEDVKDEFLCFLVGYSQIIPRDFIKQNRFYVIHESDLPAGRGWSPVSWQVLDRKNEIVVSLMHVDEKVDSGNIVLQEKMVLQGHELLDEIRLVQITVTMRLISQFLKKLNSGNLKERPQVGVPSYYPKRTRASSEIDPSKSIADSFDLLRIVDNERYPAFFTFRGHRYILRIEKG